MIAIAILAFLCLAAGALVLRVVLFLAGADEGRLARFASISWFYLSRPLAVVDWALRICYLALACLFVAFFLYSLASQLFYG